MRDEVIGAPQSSLNGPMSGTRHFATVRLDLAEVDSDEDAPWWHRQRRRSCSLCGRAATPCCSPAARSCPRAVCGRRCRSTSARRTRSTRSAMSAHVVVRRAAGGRDDPIARYRDVVERAKQLKAASNAPEARRSSSWPTSGRRSPAHCSRGRCSVAPACSTSTITEHPVPRSEYPVRRPARRGPATRTAVHQTYDRHRRGRLLRWPDGLRPQRRPHGGA